MAQGIITTQRHASAVWPGVTLLLVCMITSQALSAEDSFFKDITPQKREYVPAESEQRFSASVGPGRVLRGDILQTWLPLRHQIMIRLRQGALDTASADAALQTAWESSLETAIRDEIFHQEATRNLQNLFDRIVRQQYESQSSKRNAPFYSESFIRNRLMMAFKKDLENVIQHAVAMQTARAGGVAALHRILSLQDLTWEQWQQHIQRQAMTEWYLHRHFPLGNMAQPSPKDIRTYYKDHPEEFTIPGQTVFRHIFIDFQKHPSEDAARDRAGDVYDQLVRKELTFEDAAKKYSDDTVSATVGGLEPLPKGANGAAALESRRQAWIDDIKQALPTTEANPDSPCDAVLVSGMGCHLIDIITREPAKKTPFSEAQNGIASMIKGKNWEAKVQELYRTLRESITITIHEPTYPAIYTPSAKKSQDAPKRHATNDTDQKHKSTKDDMRDEKPRERTVTQPVAAPSPVDPINN